MRTPYHSTLQPVRLRSNLVCFHHWRYVWHGSSALRTAGGDRSSIPREKAQPVSFCVRLRQAQLFSMRMR